MQKKLKNKKKFLILMIIALLPTQITTTSYDHVNRLYPIGATIFAGSLAYAAYLHLNQPTTPIIPHVQQDSSIQSIIFDLDGVLSSTNKLRAFYEVGISTTLWEIADQMQLPSEKLLFDALADVPAVSTSKSFNKGLLMPQIMIDWQTGAQDLPAIKKSIIDYLATANKPESVKNWVLQTAMMMTDPEKFIATRQAINDNVALLHELKEKGYKLYILSNWDPTSFHLFKETFPDIFKHHDKDTFDGIMISGNVGILKPNNDIFKKCLKTFTIAAETSLFVDDEAANINAAKQLGIHTILSDPNDSKTLRNDIIQQLNN